MTIFELWKVFKVFWYDRSTGQAKILLECLKLLFFKKTGEEVHNLLNTCQNFFKLYVIDITFWWVFEAKKD